MFFFLLLEVEISLCTLIPLFRSGSTHSGSVTCSASQDCGRVFPDKLCVSLFLDRFPHYAWTASWSANSDFVGSRVYTFLGVTCHLHFRQNDWGLLHATAVTWVWNGHRIRFSTQSLLWRRKFSRQSSWDSNSQPRNQETIKYTWRWMNCVNITLQSSTANCFTPDLKWKLSKQFLKKQVRALFLMHTNK